MMIRLQNAPCMAEIGGNGTCYPRNQCSQLGGTASGSCAAGFGVCCVCKCFTFKHYNLLKLICIHEQICANEIVMYLIVQKTCNTETNQNVTYFTNPEWPGTYDKSVECPITIQKVDSNICQYR